MAAYTVLNLNEVENSAERFGLTPNMEARFPGDQLGLERSGVSLQRLAPGFRQPFGHRHNKQEELYVVVEGSARVNLDGEIVELRTWDALRVEPGVTRCLEGGPEGVGFLAFGAPYTEPRGQDADMIQGWWGSA